MPFLSVSSNTMSCVMNNHILFLLSFFNCTDSYVCVKDDGFALLPSPPVVRPPRRPGRLTLCLNRPLHPFGRDSCTIHVNISFTQHLSAAARAPRPTRLVTALFRSLGKWWFHVNDVTSINHRARSYRGRTRVTLTAYWKKIMGPSARRGLRSSRASSIFQRAKFVIWILLSR